MMKNKWKPYLIFFVVLFALYLLVVFSITDISKSNLPVISTVHDFSFIDQHSRPLTQKEVDGKVYVAEYFFTTCKSICPRMNANMRRVYDVYKDENDFMILSHTCMPETDSVPLLKKYEAMMLTHSLLQKPDGSYRVDTNTANSTATNNRNWFFLTGDKAQLYNMARHSYVIDDSKQDTLPKIADEFIHTQLFSLVDKQGRVRGIYDGLKEDEVQKLIKDIKGLLKEKYQTRSLN